MADATGAILNILMKVAVAVAVAIVIFAPQWVPILKRFSFKSTEINILGSKIEIVDLATAGDGIKLTDDGRMFIGDVEASEIPDLIAKLRQAGENLTAENNNLKTSVQKLQALFDDTKKQLDEANAKLERSSESPVPSGDLTAQIKATTDFAAEQVRRSEEVAAAATEVIQQEQPEMSAGVGFGIVFGADGSTEDAMTEARKVKKVADNPIILFKRQRWWRSAVYFGTRSAADDAIQAVKNVKPDAYIVDISKWCPAPQRLSPQAGIDAELRDCGF